MRAERLDLGDLVLDPLRVEDAVAMVAVLAPVELYRFTGGEPPTLPALIERYRRQTVGRSADGASIWLNWIVREGSEPVSVPVGFVQATVVDGGTRAELAWVITPTRQGRGMASRAARAVLDWLTGRGVRTVETHIHPDHAASAAVASRLGLHPTGAVVEGENRWLLDVGRPVRAT